MPVLMPRIRLAQMDEVRIQRPVIGAYDGESTDDFLTETASAQMERLISSRDQVVMERAAAASSLELGAGCRIVAVAWIARTIDKGDLVDLVYGT